MICRHNPSNIVLSTSVKLHIVSTVPADEVKELLTKGSKLLSAGARQSQKLNGGRLPQWRIGAEF